MANTVHLFAHKGLINFFLSSILRAGRGYNDHGTLGMTPESAPQTN